MMAVTEIPLGYWCWALNKIVSLCLKLAEGNIIHYQEKQTQVFLLHWRWDIKRGSKVWKQDWFYWEKLTRKKFRGNTEIKKLICEICLSLFSVLRWIGKQDQQRCEKVLGKWVLQYIWLFRGQWLGQFSSLCSYTPSLPAFSQVLWSRAPHPHFLRPGAGPSSFKNLARSAGSGDLSAEGTEGTAGTSSKSGWKRVTTVGEGGWKISTTAEASGKTSE